MAKKPEHANEPWTKAQEAKLEELAKGNTPTRLIGLKLGRTPSAVQTEASKLNVSLKPPNQPPDKRRHGK
jgi:hypothetical protein